MLRRATRVVTAAYDRALAHTGITVTQYAILVRIGRSDGRRVTRTELAAQMAMDRTTFTRNLGPMERRGWVRSSAGEDDRRRKALELTAEGRKLVEAAYPVWREAQREMVARLGTERWQELRMLLGDLEQKQAI